MALGQFQALLMCGRADEAERCLDEIDALLPRAGDSGTPMESCRGDLAVAREDWPKAVHWYARNAVRPVLPDQ